MKQATACKAMKLIAASFSCALKNKFGDANCSGVEMILIGQIFAVGSQGSFQIMPSFI